ncbi:hypothetical protein M404DRAFT_998037 [Pisolithus tinctorius Marx 270]|uniref:Uncharacterized protein n=1 Tax=Pisolithus tinctorius Marx 270 TaxID=870435 RepID=A0A0C3JFM8_PISTI|nr:hypothetical protein M404DRAFT_998037 [Pisolithus tinctorius Marx 270]
MQEGAQLLPPQNSHDHMRLEQPRLDASDMDRYANICRPNTHVPIAQRISTHQCGTPLAKLIRSWFEEFHFSKSTPEGSSDARGLVTARSYFKCGVASNPQHFRFAHIYEVLQTPDVKLHLALQI